MQAPAKSQTVPSVATVQTRIDAADEHRRETVDEQFHRITGCHPTAEQPDEVCAELSEWLRENETDVVALLEESNATFEAVQYDELRDVFETAWAGDTIEEGELVATTTLQAAEVFAECRALLDDTDGESRWSALKNASEELDESHPDSPTTEKVARTIDASRPPSIDRVERLLEEAESPLSGGPDDDTWEALEGLAPSLREEIPHTAITDEVTSALDGEDRPSEERASELLTEAQTILKRVRTVQAEFDELDDGSIVLIGRSE
jgi:predicted RNase H-like HicB family nuclease